MSFWVSILFIAEWTYADSKIYGYMSVGKESNQVIGVSRVRRKPQEIYRTVFGRGLNKNLQVDLAQIKLAFPDSGKMGSYQVVQVIAPGDEAKLFYFSAPRISSLRKFESCLIEAEMKSSPFKNTEPFKKAMEVKVSQRTPEALEEIWKSPEVAESRKVIAGLAVEWESALHRLSLIEINKEEDCDQPSAISDLLKKEPLFSDFKITDRKWETLEEDYPIVPMAAMGEYLEYWLSQKNGLPHLFFGRLFSGPMSMIKTEITRLSEENYGVPGSKGSRRKAQNLLTEFKIGLLSLFAKPIFEFWIDQEIPNQLYVNGSVGKGEPFETFLISYP